MDIGDGFRRRYFHERLKAESQEGNPVHRDVTRDARSRLFREIRVMAWKPGEYPNNNLMFSFFESIESQVRTVFGNPSTRGNLDIYALALPVERFLGILEIAIEQLWNRRARLLDILQLQSILADDLSAFRIRNVGSENAPHWQIQLIDNDHLHSEIVDRTFELTRVSDFASAQRDYAEAWKHFSKGDFDDALVNAHKAFESAAKVVIKLVDPTTNPDELQTNQLVPQLARLDIIPSRLQSMVTSLRQIFMSAGTLRNAAGTGHGSLDLVGPEASVALLGLRISGSLVCFMAERWKQLSS